MRHRVFQCVSNSGASRSGHLPAFSRHSWVAERAPLDSQPPVVRPATRMGHQMVVIYPCDSHARRLGSAPVTSRHSVFNYSGDPRGMDGSTSTTRPTLMGLESTHVAGRSEVMVHGTVARVVSGMVSQMGG